MNRHVIKNDYENGTKMNTPEVWCGARLHWLHRAFTDTHHVAQSVGGSIRPCKKCIKAIIKELSKEL